MTTPSAPADNRELVITRLIDAPREKLFQAWTDPELLPKWFCPRPWAVSHAELDVRSGGGSLIIMRGPEGQEFPNRGIYLEVIPNEKIVFTDAYTAGWVPSEKPFFTGVITFEEEDGKTRYTARARHWTTEDRDKHDQMGFTVGWGLATDQLVELVTAQG